MVTESQIGGNIRALRHDRGLSLAELAGKAELTKGALSKIENATTSPPIATLMRIANALDVSIAAFFEQPQAPQRVAITRKNEGHIITRDGTKFGYAYEALALDMPRKLAEPFILTIEPDDPPGEFKHGGDEFLYMIQGRMRITIGDKAHTIGSGDSVYFDPQLTHSFKVLGKRPAKFLCLFLHEHKKTKGSKGLL
ncbi:MAG: cupin domain-containing protein [Phycisphaeraceae bacterium]|nr:cupin domain-containing protein [Phycisphaeraceae bacterium]